VAVTIQRRKHQHRIIHLKKQSIPAFRFEENPEHSPRTQSQRTPASSREDTEYPACPCIDNIITDTMNEFPQHHENPKNGCRRRLILLAVSGMVVVAAVVALATVLAKKNQDDSDDKVVVGTSSRVEEVVAETSSRVEERPVTSANSSSSGSCNCTLLEVTMEELQRHNTEEDCWVAFYDLVYDVTAYAPLHDVGGASVIYGLCGRDGTLQFAAFHPPSYLATVSLEYLVGVLVVQEEEEEEEQTTMPSTNLSTSDPSNPEAVAGQRFDLPAAINGVGTSLTDALAQRRSVRSFVSPDEESSSITLAEISQLFWAAQGENNHEYKRTAPSAGALYPLEVYLVMASGVYHYIPDGHYLERHNNTQEDLRFDLADAALSQEFIAEAPESLQLDFI
jgi:cytochrome b involved in lipid metabolism